MLNGHNQPFVDSYYVPSAELHVNHVERLVSVAKQ